MNMHDDSICPGSAGAEKTLASTRGSKTTSRRAFVQQVGAAAGAAAAVLASPARGSAESVPGRFPHSPSGTPPPADITDGRILEAFQLRADMAMQDALLGPAVNVNNGDLARYGDQGGAYTKALPH